MSTKVLLLSLLAGTFLLVPSITNANVTVYQHCGYKGYRVTLRPGNYNLGRLRRLGIKNDDLSAIAVPKGYSVTIYKHSNYRGKSLTFKSHVRCLVRYRFNDMISSLVVRRIQKPRPNYVATLYRHCGYKGKKVYLAPGSYNLSMLRRLGMRNDDVSAIALSPGWEAVLYKHDHFKGPRIVFKGSDSCFVDNRFNDMMSSVVIRRRTKKTRPLVATLYRHCGYKGKKVYLKAGSYNLSMLRRLGMRNDDISAIALSPGYKAILYKHDNFKGPRITFKRSDSCFVDNRFNDMMSSIIIMRK